MISLGQHWLILLEFVDLLQACFTLVVCCVVHISVLNITDRMVPTGNSTSSGQQTS